MAEFSSLNGYQVKDTVARSIAKGRNQAVAFVDYETMIESLNGLEKDEYRAGQNIYIGVVGVPDLWVYGIEDIVHNFEYVSDEDIVEMLKNNTTIQVGYYKLAMLEGQKVDLTTYDQHLIKHDDDIAELNDDVAGINESLVASDNLKFQFATDGEGNYGYLGADDSFIPFNSVKEIISINGYSDQTWNAFANIKNNYFVPYANYTVINNNSEYFKMSGIATTNLIAKKDCNVLKFDNNGITEKKYFTDETILTVNWKHGSYIAIVK